MKKRIQSQPFVSLAALAAASEPKRREGDRRDAGAMEKRVESGLLRLCEEIAGSLLRRYLELRDPVRAVREIRQSLVKCLRCREERAGQIVDLALELIHVKAHGNFKRNALELSQLIARAGNQLRNVADN